MKYISILLLMLPFAGKSALAQHISPDTVDVRWALIWQDEFPEDGAPDSSKWSFTGRGSSPWNCYCADDPATAVVRNGRLYLSGIVSRQAADTAPYLTGCIETKHKFSFKYGKVEVRAKVPKAQGSWPAIWLMPEESVYGGWPRSGEIDVMEHLNHDSIFYQTVHSGYTYIEKHTQNPPHGGKAPLDRDAFNVYGMEWYPDRMDFFINGIKTFTYPKLQDGPASQWPFDQPFYLILDQALGGWPGEIKNEDLPATMIVDWVKVYRDTAEHPDLK